MNDRPSSHTAPGDTASTDTGPPGPERDVVRLSPGNGVVARRDRAVLFLPDADRELLTTFISASPESAVEAVTASADAADDDRRRFVTVEWSDRVRLVVCGDVEVTTDQPSLPRLSARGAGTWVERTLRLDDPAVTVTVTDGGEPDELTDLADGVVRAGGFELHIVSAATPANPVPPPTPAPVATSDTPTSDSVSPETVSPEAVSPEAVPPEAEPSDHRPTTAQRVASEVLGSSGGPSPDERFAAGPDDVTIVPDPPAPHGSPPASPTRWRLDFADGETEAVDRTLVFGRSPTYRDGETESTTRLVRVECRQVSSRHLAVTADGDGVTLVDLGSSNGSFVLTTGDGRLVQLEPGVPHRVGVGTIVQIGTRRFTVADAS